MRVGRVLAPERLQVVAAGLLPPTQGGDSSARGPRRPRGGGDRAAAHLPPRRSARSGLPTDQVGHGQVAVDVRDTPGPAAGDAGVGLRLGTSPGRA